MKICPGLRGVIPCRSSVCAECGLLLLDSIGWEISLALLAVNGFGESGFRSSCEWKSGRRKLGLEGCGCDIA
ncbi:hypothetical protein [Bacteroides reticulotermitis]|uniref:hypothetical protein n=1 Tax=Bacteroides reticulotermitis TaxID=1133319 RepID=UPI0011DDC894|nr:hypothetical protein [Bacteroides reticulotermitis]